MTILNQARENRKNPSKLLAILWDNFRSYNRGYKVRRQHIIRDFIVDFYIPSTKLIIHFSYISQPDKEKLLDIKDYKFLIITNESLLKDVNQFLSMVDSLVLGEQK